MKQLLLEIGSGALSVTDVPRPSKKAGTIVVETRASLVSGGTEGMLLDFGRSSLLEKARSQPDRVRQVIDKAATDGIMPTLAAVREKLADSISPGYCQAGVVVEVGDSEAQFSPGDRVVTNGPHAEFVRVPYNLAARIPAGVDFEAACFAPLAAIALQGVRLAEPTLGETVVVFGLGLVGQLAVQIVRANGCSCIGIDMDPQRVALAEELGAIGLHATSTSVVDAVRAATDGIGADAVLMTLATDSDEPMHQAAEMSRKRGRIVLVGVTGLDLRRADFYEKELTFQVSCSYGPGRYDPNYEEKGNDYPLPFVRWTEQRNFEAVLDLMADARLNTRTLVSHRFAFSEAPAAYDVLVGDATNLGIVFDYPERETEDRGGSTGSTIRLRQPESVERGSGIAGLIGAGNFARRTLIPAIRAAEMEIRTVVSSGGRSAAVQGDRAGAIFASSDVRSVLDDPEIDTVFVLTRHDTHARLVSEALEAGKHVFVEKPLALTLDELELLRGSLEKSERLLMVGFNRRFAPLAAEMKEIVLSRAGPLSLILTVNAGRVPSEHWTQDPDRGGGRIVGEACHFIDLARFLVGHPISDLSARAAMGPDGLVVEDISHLTLGFEDGSTAAIHYLANGSSRFPKERIEAFFDGNTAAIDNWRRLRTWGLGRRNRLLPRRLDKGHEAEIEAFVDAVRGQGSAPIGLDELFEVSRWSIRAAELVRRSAETDRQA